LRAVSSIVAHLHGIYPVIAGAGGAEGAEPGAATIATVMPLAMLPAFSVITSGGPPGRSLYHWSDVPLLPPRNFTV
jgi:hypothetical protein